MAVVGAYAYVAAGAAGLRIINVMDPAHPVAVGTYDTSVSRAVDVAESYAYVVAGYSGLHVINVADPTVPIEVGALDTPGYALGVAVAGSYAYVATHEGGLVILYLTGGDYKTYLPVIIH